MLKKLRNSTGEEQEKRESSSPIHKRGGVTPEEAHPNKTKIKATGRESAMRGPVSRVNDSSRTSTLLHHGCQRHI